MATWADVGRVVQRVVPIAGNILVGNVPGAVAQVSDWISGGLGTANNPDAVLARLQNDPAALVRVQEILANKQVELERIEASREQANLTAQIAELQATLTDVQSARARDMAYIAAGKENNRANWMVAGAVVGLVVCVAAAVVMKLHGDLDTASATLLTTFATYFGLSLRDCYSFEFGSSRSSKSKDETIKVLSEKP